jgi:hypothetical protein
VAGGLIKIGSRDSHWEIEGGSRASPLLVTWVC